MAESATTETLEEAAEREAAEKGRHGYLPGYSPTGSGHEGISSGVNIEPGSNDDGWVVPDPVRLTDGTELQLYKDGEALHAAFEAIGRARQRVCLESYIFADDPTGRAFAERLAQKARDGVKVYVIYDAFGSVTSGHELFNSMARAGVLLGEFHPINPWRCRYGWRPFNRDHRKLLVIDDQVGGLGGLNVGAEYAGSWVVRERDPSCDPWRDNAVGMRGPAVRHLVHAFANTWNYIQRGGRIHRAGYFHLPERGELGLLATVPTLDSGLRPTLKALFREARERIELTMAYFAPDDDLVQSLCKAAQRGVKVRIMLPRECDVPILVTAARAFYSTLMRAGVEIFERCGVVLHAKTMVIDRMVSVIGSTNLDYRSIEYNCEISAIIRNAEFGRQISALFDHDVAYAERIEPAQWHRRHWLDKLGQLAVYRARYLL